MMLKVWKFPIETTDMQTIEMPKNRDILSADMQGGRLCIWVAVIPTDEFEEVTIVVAGTGNPMPKPEGFKDAKFIDTVFDGALVWHVFEYFK